jgi:type I restriction enzyme S subunit
MKASNPFPRVRLGDVCGYRTDKIAIDRLDADTYISTENMLPERGGITASAGLPATATTQAYYTGDVLVSNIRPYFKKIWFAASDGGCSNDVLVFKAKENCAPEYLYYVLSDDKFFDYSTATAKGTKMPRGDKAAIMQYTIPLPPLPVQRSIAATLSCLDAKIELNRRVNANLEAQAQALFKRWFVDFEPWGGKMPVNWREV